jgi:hypothetical protein
MWENVRLKIKEKSSDQDIDEIRPFPQTPRILGLLESTLYTTACLLEKYEFISVWLLLKVAGGFKREL